MNNSSEQLNPSTLAVGYKWSWWRRFLCRWKLFLYMDYSIRAKRKMKSLKRGEDELRVLDQFVDPNKASIDVGANKGVYTYWLEKYSAKVYAYEANQVLVQAFLKEPRGNVEVRPFGVSNQSGTLTFRIPVGGMNPNCDNNTEPYLLHQGGNFRDKPKGSVYEIEVNTYRLDDLEHDPIGFMKIDVEGHQMEVIKGAKKLIERDKPIMMVEFVQLFHDESIHSLVPDVEKLGYTAKVLYKSELKDPNEVDQDCFVDGHPEHIKNFFFIPNGMEFSLKTTS